MKRLSVLLGLLALLIAVPAHAGRPLLTDESSLLKKAEQEIIEERLRAWITLYGTEFRMLLLRDLRGESLEARAKRTFGEWHIGEGRETGLLLVVLADGRAHLETEPGRLEPFSAELAAKAVTEAFAPSFAKEGIFVALNRLITHVEIPFKEMFGPGLHRRPLGKPVDKFRVQYWSGSFLLLAAALAATYVRRRRARSAPLDVESEKASVEESFLLAGLRRLARFPKRCPAWFDVFVLTAIALCLRLVWLNLPDDGGLIFDESYYVKHARVLLGLPVEMIEGDWWLSGLDPNAEHPPLGKLFIALTYWLGDNGWGWRMSSVVFGTASIPLLYGIVKRVRGTHTMALTAAYLLSCDNLSFLHGRIATLDASFVFFMLFAVYAYLSGYIELAGVSLALSTLCKITGVYGWATVVGFELIRLIVAKLRKLPHELPWQRLVWLTVCFAGFTLVFLGALDSCWGLYRNPIEHVQWIFLYGKNLTNLEVSGQESEPWQWLLNEVEMAYMRTARVTDGVETVVLNFRGAMNPLIVWVAPLTIGYALVRGVRRYDQLALFAVTLFFATYAPYWLLRHLAHRVCYIYYFLPTMPAVAIATSVTLHTLTPRWLRILYLLAVTAAAAYYFPFRELPEAFPIPLPWQ